MRLARLALAVSLAAALPAAAAPEDDRFRAANELARAADYPKAMAGYAELSRSGAESASLYWNWAQSAAAGGAQGEALWAMLRARELDPGDRAVGREIDRLRDALNLDRAEIAPEPLAAAGRFSRRWRLDLVAAALLLLSLAAHAAVRLRRRAGGVWRAAPPTLLALGLLAAVPSVAGSYARPTAAVVHRGAPLFDAASPTAAPIGTLREGEVVPVLEASGEWLRVEDNAGARGWARWEDVRRLDRAPAG
jgi:hypothetical protein